LLVLSSLAVCFDGEKYLQRNLSDDVTINQKLGNRAYYIAMVDDRRARDITAKSVTAKLATMGLLNAQGVAATNVLFSGGTGNR
jgi:hypothetical protein